MEITEDTSLIQNILDGDERSEKKLYDKYKKIVENYLKHKYPNNENFDDDVSEILIKIFQSLPSYDIEKSKFKSWVFTIAKNHMIDKSRTFDILCGTHTLDDIDGTITLSDGGEKCYYSSDTNLNPEGINMSYTVSHITNFENCDALSHISNQIESCDFTFLNMKYSEGYNYSEIGMEFNMTSNTISNRVNYIKSKIKKCVNFDE